MDDHESGESATQPAEVEETLPPVEETRTDTEVNGETTASDGSLERPREETAKEENPEQPTNLPGETAEAVVVGDETAAGGERETTPAEQAVENQQEREEEGTRVDGGGEQQEETKEEGDENKPVAEERLEREDEGAAVGDEGERKEDEGGEEDTQTQQTSSQTESTPKETKKREKERKKADKKSKKKSRHSREDTPSSPPKLRKRMGRSEGRSTQGGGGQMEEILLAMFQPFDPYGHGSVDASTFWEIIQSTDLNLQLGPQELSALQEVVTPDRSGLIPYAEFAAQANDILTSLYQEKPASEDYRVRMATPSGNRVLSYDKQTGEFQDLVEEGVDPFEENIRNLYQSVDTEGRGYITREEFMTVFRLEQLLQLNEEDHSQMMQYYDQAIPSGQAQYEEFYPLGRELILRLYRNQDTSGSDWIHLHSEQLGHYQLNKYTGEIHRDPALQALQASATHPQMDLVNQAYLQVEEVTFEKEQYKQENKDLQNQLRQAREEQETLAMQLDQTGHILDEANVEIRQKENELAQLQAELAGKEHENDDMKTQLVEAAVIKKRLQMLEQELQTAQGEVEEREQNMVVRDSSISTLQKQSLGVVDKLKTAWATIDARDSTIVKLQHQLKTEQNRMKTYVEQTPILESKVAALEGEVRCVNQSLEEKTSALASTCKHLKNARERNLELEKTAEKATVTQDKLRGAEAEIRTLKGLLTSKTAMVERRKKELAETRTRLLDLEEKDNRRSIILADVLERTARQYQHTLQVSATEAMTFDPLSTSQYMDPSVRRPVSAPPIPPDQITLPPHHHTVTEITHPTTHPPKVVRTYTMPAGGKSAPSPNTRPAHKEPQHSPKLPPIHQRGRGTKRSSFHVPTEKELVEQQRRKDREMVQHSESNPRCECQLCVAGGATEGSMGNGVRLDEQVALAGLSGSQELTLSRQLDAGQRVLVTMKRSEFDLEPQQYTGIVKYVGKIDSEFIDNRMYVGVKLDEPVGDTDGLFKGKRYFHCPPKHGKVVRLSSVLAILPKRSVSYKPLQISKRSPYSTAPSSHKRSRLKVT